jgi:hypothetical protein
MGQEAAYYGTRLRLEAPALEDTKIFWRGLALGLQGLFELLYGGPGGYFFEWAMDYEPLLASA